MGRELARLRGVAGIVVALLAVGGCVTGAPADPPGTANFGVNDSTRSAFGAGAGSTSLSGGIGGMSGSMAAPANAGGPLPSVPVGGAGVGGTGGAGGHVPNSTAGTGG